MAKDKSAEQFDRRHRTLNLSDLVVGDYVWVTDLRVYGKIIKVLDEPRSYLVQSNNSGIYRRNRWHLIPAPYYVEPRFTQAWAAPNKDKNKYQYEVDRSENPRENGETRVNVDSEKVELVPGHNFDSDQITRGENGVPNMSQTEFLEISPGVSPTRSKRLVRKPNYFKDYVLS